MLKMNCIEQMISEGNFSIPMIQRKLRISADKAKEILAEYGINLSYGSSEKFGAWQQRRQKRILKNKMLRIENGMD